MGLTPNLDDNDRVRATFTWASRCDGGRAARRGAPGLGDVAPGADLATLRPDLAFRERLDLDSMDMLNFVVALHGALGVDPRDGLS